YSFPRKGDNSDHSPLLYCKRDPSLLFLSPSRGLYALPKWGCEPHLLVCFVPVGLGSPELGSGVRICTASMPYSGLFSLWKTLQRQPTIRKPTAEHFC